MLSKIRQVPNRYYGAIAASLLLLAWSIDSFLQKTIGSVADAMNRSEAIQLRGDFEASVLHAVADIRDELMTLNQTNGNADSEKGGIPIEFTNINSGRNIRVNQYINRFQAFRLRAEITAAAYQGVGLPDEIEEKIDRSIDFLWALNTALSKKNQAIVKHIQGVMLGRKLDVVDANLTAPLSMGKPTQDDIDTLDQLYDRFWKINIQALRGMAQYTEDMASVSEEASLYVASRKKTYTNVSSAISVLYIVVFFLGSAITVLATIKKAHRESGAESEPVSRTDR